MRAALLLSALVGLTVGCGGKETKQKCTPDCSDRTCGDDGCGGTCGSCRAWQSCIGTACSVNPASTWDVVALDASVSTADVTDFPNPFVCLTVDEVQSCTDVANGQFNVTWDKTLFLKTPASSMLGNVFGGGFDFGLYDHQNTGDHRICVGHTHADPQNFDDGRFTLQCDGSTTESTIELVYDP
jgi:hypothetical protein